VIPPFSLKEMTMPVQLHVNETASAWSAPRR
jgi:hypothetical protein